MRKLLFKKFLLLPVFTLLFAAPSICEQKMAKDLKFKLIGGDLMPLVGFGTYLIEGTDLIKEVLDHALGAGYRLIDSATVYGNEADIGKALKTLLPKHNLTRKDIFITSKLSTSDQGDKAYEAVKTSLKKLDCEYIDLYLIHWPGSYGINSTNVTNSQLRDRSWELLVKAQKEGLVRNIGVSNYNVRHLNELFSKSHGVIPAVNQVEWHPHYHQPELKQLCDEKGILLQAYSSLGGTGNLDLLKNPTVKKIAEKLKKTPAQVLLRWPLQNNIGIIPKARSKARIEENIQLDFEIPEEDMNALNGFTQQKYAWDPTNVA